MTMDELSSRSGVSRENIRYYQKKGLLPDEKDFSPEMLLRIKRIRLLRSMGIPFAEVCRLVWKQDSLQDVLTRQHYGIRRDLSPWVRETGMALLEQKAVFSDFDPEPFLGDSLPMPLEGLLPYANCSWRRLFARCIDLACYQVVVSILFAACRIWWGPWYVSLFSGILCGLMMLILEPFWLRFAGYTPGKAIFRLKVRSADGGKLPLYEGYRRTWGMLVNGMGMYIIPIYSLYCFYRSWKTCRDGQRLDWDFNADTQPLQYTAPEEMSRWSGFLFVGVYLVCMALMGVIPLFNLVPPHTGSVTVAEFAENFNYYTEYGAYPDGIVPYILDEEGKWQSMSTVTVSLADNQMPEFQYVVENGKLVEVQYTDTQTDGLFASLHSSLIQQMILSLSADWNPFGTVHTMRQLDRVFEDHLATDYTGQTGNCTYSWTVLAEGYSYQEYLGGYMADSEESGLVTQTVTIRKK